MFTGINPLRRRIISACFIVKACNRIKVIVATRQLWAPKNVKTLAIIPIPNYFNLVYANMAYTGAWLSILGLGFLPSNWKKRTMPSLILTSKIISLLTQQLLWLKSRESLWEVVHARKLYLQDCTSKSRSARAPKGEFQNENSRVEDIALKRTTPTVDHDLLVVRFIGALTQATCVLMNQRLCSQSPGYLADSILFIRTLCPTTSVAYLINDTWARTDVQYFLIAHY